MVDKNGVIITDGMSEEKLMIELGKRHKVLEDLGLDTKSSNIFVADILSIGKELAKLKNN